MRLTRATRSGEARRPPVAQPGMPDRADRRTAGLSSACSCSSRMYVAELAFSTSRPELAVLLLDGR